MEENIKEEKIKNVISDTRRRIQYVIWASKKLDREGMLKQIRNFNASSSHNIRQKGGSVVEITADESI